MNTTEPTSEDQVVLCNVLLESPLVVTCTPPGGEEMTQPTIAPLGTSRYFHFHCMVRRIHCPVYNDSD